MGCQPNAKVIHIFAKQKSCISRLVDHKDRLGGSVIQGVAGSAEPWSTSLSAVRNPFGALVGAGGLGWTIASISAMRAMTASRLTAPGHRLGSLCL